jgi:hypothetical protein
MSDGISDSHDSGGIKHCRTGAMLLLYTVAHHIGGEGRDSVLRLRMTGASRASRSKMKRWEPARCCVEDKCIH